VGHVVVAAVATNLIGHNSRVRRPAPWSRIVFRSTGGHVRAEGLDDCRCYSVAGSPAPGWEFRSAWRAEC
jgi:hypothetical protein